jgi:hypothetical protein
MTRILRPEAAAGKAAAPAGRTGEKGLERLLSESALAVVNEIHGLGARRPTDEEMLALKSRLEGVLSDSGAQSLRGVATDLVPLRCRGDPHELGRIDNLLDAVSECRDYVCGELSKRGVPHLENPRTWNGY